MKNLSLLLIFIFLFVTCYAQDSSNQRPYPDYFSTYSRLDNWKLQKMKWSRTYSYKNPSIFVPRYIAGGWMTNPEYVTAPLKLTMPLSYQPGQMMLSVTNYQTLGKIRISNAFYFNEQTMQFQQARTTLHFGR